MAEHEEEVKPEVRSHSADVIKDEVPPEQQDRSHRLDQENPPELLHIKEEQEELWSSQEGEQLGGLEEAEIIKFTFNPVSVKTEEDGEEGRGEPARNSHPDLQPAAQDETSDSSEPDGSHECEAGEPQAGLKSLQHNEEGRLQKQAGVQTGEKPFGCTVCGKTYRLKSSLVNHMRLHSVEEPFSCSVCEKSFHRRAGLVRHMKIHSGEKPFSCSECDKTFSRKENLKQHLIVHTGEKPFSCPFCGLRFTQQSGLTFHLRVHTGEKPYKCSVCETSFSLRSTLSTHMRLHTGEKPFSCSVCGTKFAHRSNLTSHLSVHTEEKPFACSVCTKSFSHRRYLSKHMRIHAEDLM